MQYKPSDRALHGVSNTLAEGQQRGSVVFVSIGSLCNALKEEEKYILSKKKKKKLNK